MSVLIETSVGDLVIDLYCEESAEGDPSGTGKSGYSIHNQLPPYTKYFQPSVNPKLKHKNLGTVSLALTANPQNDLLAGSQFFITLSENVDYLDGKHCIIGQVAEGFEVLEKINEAFVDGNNKPLRAIRIKHTIVLDDPFPDPPKLKIPSRSPSPDKSILASLQIEENESLDEELTEEQREKASREKEAKAQALTLEMVGDLPFANVKPAENVLFVCKLNPVTTDQDLELIFSRFGPIVSCEIIRDNKTNDSLGYAFIEFENQPDCEEAYFKMDNVLIDDRRIHVDFSQSVSKLNQLVDNKANHGGYQLRDKFKVQNSSEYLFEHQNKPNRSNRSDGRSSHRSSNERDKESYKGDSTRNERYDDKRSHSGKREDKRVRDSRDYRKDRSNYRYHSRSRSPTRHSHRR